MITNDELIKTPQYWMENIQNELYRQVKRYLDENNLNQTQFAEKLNFTRGYVSQVLNGNFNFTLKKLIELSLAVGMAPDLEFRSFSDYLLKEHMNMIDSGYALPATAGIAMKADREKTMTAGRPTGIVISMKPVKMTPDPTYSKTA